MRKAVGCSRRRLIRTGIGGFCAASAISAVGEAGATTTATIEGRITAENGATVEYDSVHLITNGEDRTLTHTDQEGRFSATVTEGKTYRIGFYKSSQETFYEPLRNGVPHIYDFGRYTIGTETKTLDLELPQAYLVDFQAQDTSGEPVTDAQLEFRYGIWGDSPYRTTVTEDGYYQIKDASFTGAEFGKTVRAELEPPSDGDYGRDQYYEEAEITGPTTFTAILDGSTVDWSVEREGATPRSTSTQEPASTATDTPSPAPSRTSTPPSRTQSRTVTSRPKTESATATRTNTATQTEKGRRRGFLSNGQEPTFGVLENPLFLTVGGFVLSVLGILYQMVRGQ